jgi:hypothetical protein
MTKKLLVLLAISLGLNATASAEAYVTQGPQLSQGRYIAGGLTTLLVGYGVGHAVQGRWAEKGWIFTVGEVASTGLIVGGYGWMASNIYSAGTRTSTGAVYSTQPNLGGPAGLMVAGSVVLAGFRIWEIIDSFSAPTFDEYQRHASIEKRAPSTELAFLPLISTESLGFVMTF